MCILGLTKINMEDLIQKIITEDKDFSESKFKAKADNIFIQVYTAVMKKDLTRVKHFLSEDLYKKFEQKIQMLDDEGLIQVYGELNVSDTEIVRIIENDESYEIEVKLLTKYLDYKLDKQTRNIVSGNDEVRIIKNMRLVFSKRKNAKSLGVARKCPGCGANMDIAMNGKCEYCGSIFKLEEYDWVLIEIEG